MSTAHDTHIKDYHAVDMFRPLKLDTIKSTTYKNMQRNLLLIIIILIIVMFSGT